MLIVVNEERLLRRRQEIGTRIKRARDLAGLSQDGVAGMLGITGATISKWENGKSDVDIPTLEEVARVLRQPLRFFTGEEGPRRDTELEALGREVMQVVERRQLTRVHPVRVDAETVTIPVTNSIAASELMGHDRQVEDRITVSADLVRGAREPVAFFVVGNCLRGEGIVSGDYLIVDKANKEPQDGEIVAALVNGEETAKCFFRIGDTVELRPASPGYKPIIVTGDDELEIIGVYVGVLATGKRGRR